MSVSDNSFNTKSSLDVNGKAYSYYAINGGDLAPHPAVGRLPVSIKILLENLLRHEDGLSCSREDIEALAASGGRGSTQGDCLPPRAGADAGLHRRPGRNVDLAAMRDALVKQGADPQKINPLSRVDLIIDHSVSIDRFATSSAFKENVAIEMQRNHERYQFLKWGQAAFDNFSVVPPGTGICHQVNLEYLARTVWSQDT